MNPKTLAGWLAFTMYISAARADASAGQLFEMRRVITPAIEGLKRRDLTPEETRRLLAIVLTRVQTIMGKDWQPQGEWMVAINSILGKE